MKIDAIEGQAVILAERFLLRPLRQSDVGLLEMYMADRRVAEATRAIPHPLPPGTTEAFIARSLHPKRVDDIWALDGSAHGLAAVLGLVLLTRMDQVNPARRQSEISYWVAPAFWNTGFASEAVRALVQANPHDACTHFAEVFQDNPASARVLTNGGFQYLGDAEAFSVARGVTVPTWTYIRKQG